MQSCSGNMVCHYSSDPHFFRGKPGGLRVSVQTRRPFPPQVDFTVVPDWQRRATRLSIAVCFFGMLGHSIPFPPEHAALATSFRQSCNCKQHPAGSLVQGCRCQLCIHPRTRRVY